MNKHEQKVNKESKGQSVCFDMNGKDIASLTSVINAEDLRCVLSI